MVSSANGFISIARALLRIVSNKIVAILIGAEGVALIGQLQNFMTIITQLSNGGFERGLTKYIAENKNNGKEVLEYISTSFIVTLSLSTVTSLVLILISKTVSIKIFTTSIYTSILIVFAATLFLYNLLIIILAIVNGFESYRQYFKINISLTLVGFLLTIILVFLFKEYGALLAIVLSQSLVCIVAFIFIEKEYWLKAFSFNFFNKYKLKLLLNIVLLQYLLLYLGQLYYLSELYNKEYFII